MHIAITGASGLVGTALVPLLASAGHTVARLVRTASEKKTDPTTVTWDPANHVLDASQLEGIDACIHLAGENIAGRRWTAARKDQILKSRTEPTRLVATTLAQMKKKPETFICASAIGFYGDRGDTAVDESDRPGEGFLSRVVQQWEAACQPAIDAGIRVVILRFGIILSPHGGALAKMLTPFRFGAGGRVGSGHQFWSWISIDDTISAMLHALQDDRLSGPVNVVAPQPATNMEFTKALGRVLHRPTFMPLPAIVARILLGEMADELLLASTRVVPTRLQETDFAFQHTDLVDGLRHLLES